MGALGGPTAFITGFACFAINPLAAAGALRASS